MNKEHLIIDENELSYEQVLRIREHAMGYNIASDKKEFLKSVGAYEQKLILLQSVRPYEVLEYLSQIDLETSRVVLDSLNQDEINKIVQLFTSDDKERLYNNFSELSLVNKFISCDKNASKYVTDLTIDRKIELLNSSDKETAVASSKVYESIPDEQKHIVADKVNTLDGSIALDKASSYIESSSNDSFELKEEANKIENKIEKNEIKDLENQELNEEKHLKHDDLLKASKEASLFFMQRLQYYKENVPGFENIDINDPNLYAALPPALRAIVDSDFEKTISEKEEKQINPEDKLDKQDVQPENRISEEKSPADLFNEAKTNCESDFISEINSQIEKEYTAEENIKTL